MHTLLDLLTFVATGWVLLMMHTKLKKSYTPDLDTVRIEFVVRLMCRVRTPFTDVSAAN